MAFMVNAMGSLMSGGITAATGAIDWLYALAGFYRPDLPCQ